ncbi:MAG: hypothetical protein M1826_001640 [Phylliscum demangeonii]|nr:MAG: hypothetical protein M1826_001640 [Phylliscum demangeonii]
MTASYIAPPHLCNGLASSEQLCSSSSQLDGTAPDLEQSIRYGGAQLTQHAGILLRLPQDIIAAAIVLFTRFWAGPEGGSLRQHSAERVSAAAVYLAAKSSAFPQTPRNVLNVYTYLKAVRARPASLPTAALCPEDYYLSEGEYLSRRQALLKTEAALLRVLGFNTHVALPYTLAINYLQALDVFDNEPPAQASAVALRTFAHLTGALLSPQLLYLTHQPHALATAAIYLAARQVAVKLPAEQEWWRVFDVEREELGFLVVALVSMPGFVRAEKEKWAAAGAIVPLDVRALEKELERRRTLVEEHGQDEDDDDHGSPTGTG